MIASPSTRPRSLTASPISASEPARWRTDPLLARLLADGVSLIAFPSFDRLTREVAWQTDLDSGQLLLRQSRPNLAECDGIEPVPLLLWALFHLTSLPAALPR